jgi:hypothetical protein
VVFIPHPEIVHVNPALACRCVCLH